jgi:HEAT repeat protein
VYVEASEFGDSSDESAVLWSHGKNVLSRSDIGAVLRYFRDQAEIQFRKKDFDLEKYRGETAAEKWAAAAILHEFVDRSEKPVLALIEALHYERKSKTIQDFVRQFAAASLEELGPAAKEAIPALEQTLKSEQDLGICITAASALAAIGPEAVPVLVSALAVAVYDKQWAILHGLGKLGPAARQAVPVLMKILQKEVLHDFLEVRSEAAESLGKIGPGAGPAVPALIEALRDKDWVVRSHAAEALGEIGLHAWDAVGSALSDAQNDENEWVRQAAGRALAKVQGKAASVQKDLQIGSPSAGTWGEMGPEARAAVRKLIEGLKNKDWIIRCAAAESLGKTGPDIWDVVTALNEAQNDENEWVREAAGRALAKVQDKRPGRSRTTSEDEDLRAALLEGLRDDGYRD